MAQDYDHDLQSIQEARSLAEAAHEAQQKFFRFSQEQVDRICAAMANAAYRESERLGRMASEETGYGIPRHKTLKNPGQQICVGVDQKYQDGGGSLPRPGQGHH
jgi:acetaldehyde dehydrogenase (acetylating)